MKKIYFACSIRGGRDDQPIYQQLVEIIKKEAQVLSEVFGDSSLSSQGENRLSNMQIYNRDINWIKEADGVIAEATNPSLGVGYEIAKAEEWGMPVLVLYRPATDRRLSAMIAGSPSVKLHNYQNLDEAKDTILSWIRDINT